MKIIRVKFYQNIEMGGNLLPVSFASSVQGSVNTRAYKITLIEGLGVQVEGEHRTVIVPFNNVSQIDIEKEAEVKAEPKGTKKGA